MSEKHDFINTGKQVLSIEAKAIDDLVGLIDHNFSQACEIMFACKGKVIVTGMGKSGHIGKKIAATLASTGTPAFFVHPGEASHGDMGMMTKDDVVLALSNSGNTAEVLTLFPLLTRQQTKVVSMTGNQSSKMATTADVHIHVPIEQEACPHNLAPTTSSTAMLAMGDALAVALLQAKDFSAEDFAFSHPGGSLGKQLLTHVEDIMAQGENLPQVGHDAPISDALHEMSRCGLGLTLVNNADGKVSGIFTDGDLRRSIEKRIDLSSVKVADIMTHGGKTIKASELAMVAANIMEQSSINALIAEHEGKAVGVITMHHLLQAHVV